MWDLHNQEGGKLIRSPPRQPPETTLGRRQRAPTLMPTRPGHFLRHGAPPPPLTFPREATPTAGGRAPSVAPRRVLLHLSGPE